MEKCNEICEVWSRTVGYYRPVKNWHKGKKEEFRLRKTIKLNLDWVEVYETEDSDLEEKENEE